MKIKNQLQRLILLIIGTALFMIVDIYFADKVYRAHEPVVKGVLATTLLVLIYLYILPKRIVEEPIRVLFTPAGFKFLLASIFWAIGSYWAVIEIDDMILYLIKLFK